MSDFFRILLIVVLILGLDGLYLAGTSNLYLKNFAEIQKTPIQLNYLGAIVTYAALIFATYVTTGLGSNINLPLVTRILPNLQGQVKNARIYATAFIFLVCYLVFNGTMLAIFSDYAWGIAIMDTVWGTTLGLLVGYITQLFM